LLLKAVLTTLPESLPGELPPAYDASQLPAEAGEKPAVGEVPIKLPEFPNECLAYVPENYRSDVPAGLIVWLHAPGDAEAADLVARWKPHCEQYGFILLAPKAADPAQWQPTELAFVRRAVDEVMKRYAIDPRRVAVHGHQGGGTLAYLFAFTNSDIVRAVAAVDASLPRAARLPEPDPARRLAVYTTLATNAEQTSGVTAGIDRLRDAKYPVVVQEIGEQNRYLTAEELVSLVEWFDSLDRI
jgi:poly(3-hydroxybutyrate) depolymerase